MSIIPARHHLFGSEIHPGDLWRLPLEHGPWQWLSSPFAHIRSDLEELASNVHIDKDGFRVKVDVQHFRPDEINVKTVDNSIIIEAKHEERKDSETGYVSRQIVRRYDLPKELKAEEVVSSLSSDGILEIKCLKSEAREGAVVRKIPIQSTGPARCPAQLIEKKCDDTKEKAENE